MIVEEVGGVQGQGNPGYFSNINKKWFIAPLALTAACLLAKPLRSYSWAIGPVGGIGLNYLLKISLKGAVGGAAYVTDEEKAAAADRLAEAIGEGQNSAASLKMSEEIRTMIHQLAQPMSAQELQALEAAFVDLVRDGVEGLSFLEFTGVEHEYQVGLAIAIEKASWCNHVATDNLILMDHLDADYAVLDLRDQVIPAKWRSLSQPKVVTVVVDAGKEGEIGAQIGEKFPNTTKIVVTSVENGAYARGFERIGVRATRPLPSYESPNKEVWVYRAGVQGGYPNLEPFMYDLRALSRWGNERVESESVHIREHCKRLAEAAKKHSDSVERLWVRTAVDWDIPVRLDQIVSLEVNIGGDITSPDVQAKLDDAPDLERVSFVLDGECSIVEFEQYVINPLKHRQLESLAITLHNPTPQRKGELDALIVCFGDAFGESHTQQMVGDVYRCNFSRDEEA